MCTILVENQPCMIAWTGQLIDEISTIGTKDAAADSSALREPIRFDERQGWLTKGSRYECSSHNYGRKPKYKDRRLRAAGSEKTRAHHTHIN